MNTRERKLQQSMQKGPSCYREWNEICFDHPATASIISIWVLFRSLSSRKRKVHFSTTVWKMSCRRDRTLNSYNQYQTIRQAVPPIKAESWHQQNQAWAVNKWAIQEKLAIRRRTKRLSWDNSCDQEINELYRNVNQNNSCNHRPSASASNDASRRAEHARWHERWDSGHVCSFCLK